MLEKLAAITGLLYRKVDRQKWVPNTSHVAFCQITLAFIISQDAHGYTRNPSPCSGNK